MIKVYYLSNTSSGRTAMKWLEKHNLRYIKRKITKKKPIRIYELKKMLVCAENGFDDLLNTRSKKFRDLEYDVNECSTRYLMDAIINTPSLIKLPIIIDDKKIVAGFNENEIRCFLPKKYRREQLMNTGRFFHR